MFNKSNTSSSPLSESSESDCQFNFQECHSTNNLQLSNENLSRPDNHQVQESFSFSNVQTDLSYHDHLIELH